MQAFSQKSYYVTQNCQMRVCIDDRTRFLTRRRENENFFNRTGRKFFRPLQGRRTVFLLYNHYQSSPNRFGKNLNHFILASIERDPEECALNAIVVGFFRLFLVSVFIIIRAYRNHNSCQTYYTKKTVFSLSFS